MFAGCAGPGRLGGRARDCRFEPEPLENKHPELQQIFSDLDLFTTGRKAQRFHLNVWD